MNLETCLEDRFLLAGKSHLAQDFWRQSGVCIWKNFWILFTQLYRLPTGVLDHLKSQGSCLLVALLVIQLNILVTSQAWFLKLSFTGYFSAWNICCFPFIDSLKSRTNDLLIPALRSISSLLLPLRRDESDKDLWPLVPLWESWRWLG